MSGEPCRIHPNVPIIKGQVLYIIFFGMPNIFLIIIFFFFFFFLKKTRLQFSIQGYWCLPFAVSDYPQPPRSPQWCFNRPLTTFMVLKQMTSTKNTVLWRAGCGSGVDFSTLDDSVRFHHSIMWMNLYACLCTFLMMWYEGFLVFFFNVHWRQNAQHSLCQVEFEKSFSGPGIIQSITHFSACHCFA